METKKRKADLQLTAENVDEEVQNEVGTEPSEKSEEVKTEADAMPAPSFGGFSSYAKSNPFASALANNANKSPFGSAPVSSFGSASGSRSSFTMPPPLVLPSPKSPKANPFSSPSPAHNPFMTIVENNDDLWRSMANDKLTAEEVAKSSVFGENKSRKSPVYRSSFFGGNGHSSFSSVSASALATGASSSSIFGGSSATPIASTSAAAGNDDDEDGDEDNENNDLEGSPTSANHASMKIISLPENVKLVTGEEDDECLLQFRAKMFRLNAQIDAAAKTNGAHEGASEGSAEGENKEGDKAKLEVNSVLSAMGKEKNAKGAKSAPAKAAEWVEVGIGPLKILSRKSSQGGAGSGRLVMRREDKQGGLGTKLLLNARLDRLLTVTKPSDKMVQLVCVNHADVPVAGSAAAGAKIGTYLIKTKTSDEADDMFSIAFDFVRRAKEAEGSDAAPAATEEASVAPEGQGANKFVAAAAANTSGK